MFFLLLLPFFAQAETKLTPEYVVNRILNEGRSAKAIELDALSAYTQYYTVGAAYDLGLASSVSYEDDRSTSVSGGGNLRDRNTLWSLALTKRVPTGTVLELGYNRTRQNSIFRTVGTRSPGVYHDLAEFTITQDLLGNFFGIAERRNIEAAEELLASSQLLKKERQEELVLDSLKLFWDAYVARESLREANAQRDKYDALVKEVQNKSKLGFGSPGDLPKARAEFATQVRSSKAAWYTYSTTLDRLYTAMRMEEYERDREVVFEFPEEFPALPTMVMPSIDSLRSVSVQKTLFDAADLKKKSVDLSARWPELKLIGSAGFSGLDPNRSSVFSSVTGREHPRYLVGLELNYKFFSDGRRASLNDALVGAESAHNEWEKAKEESRRDLSAAMENVRYSYAAAASAQEEMKYWEEALKAQERLYKQGRLDFSQLIQDYNSYYRSRSSRLRALGDYHIALQTYNAAIDELVK
jgi:outer membrane protein TolC